MLRASIHRRLSSTKSYSTIETLRKQFLDPTSPFHLAPGEVGPSDDPQEGALKDANYPPLLNLDAHLDPAAADAAKKAARDKGYDGFSFWEQRVVWGDLDSFQHVNNVQYLRYLESGRIHWMRSWRHELGDKRAADILAARGLGVILKSIDIKFRRPVLYPDTLLISHQPHSPTSTAFGCRAIIQSYAQRAIVAESDSVLVWYDYDNLQKCTPPEEYSQIILRRLSK